MYSISCSCTKKRDRRGRAELGNLKPFLKLILTKTPTIESTDHTLSCGYRIDTFNNNIGSLLMNKIVQNLVQSFWGYTFLHCPCKNKSWIGSPPKTVLKIWCFLDSLPGNLLLLYNQSWHFICYLMSLGIPPYFVGVGVEGVSWELYSILRLGRGEKWAWIESFKQLKLSVMRCSSTFKWQKLLGKCLQTDFIELRLNLKKFYEIW